MQTEFEFELPKGYVDPNGEIHKRGTMRLATAADEILPLRDPGSSRTPATSPSSCSPGWSPGWAP